MSKKRRAPSAGPFWVSSALLVVVSVAAVGFGLSGAQGIARTPVEPIASPAPPSAPEPAPVAGAKPPAPEETAHQARLRAELLGETAQLLAKHPPLRFDELADAAETVEVIALAGAETIPPEPDETQDYESYKQAALGQRELVALHITRKEPFVLMLLSDGPVTYDVQTQVSGALRGVLISSSAPSTIAGLPDEVPLEIVTDGAETAPFDRRPSPRDDQEILERELRTVFPEQEIGIKRHDGQPVILVR
ncbi:MAG: hypothetical protein AAF495_08460 [Pseudomonadota bacterium]